MGKFEMFQKHHDHFYVVFRVLVGVMFMMHGWGKVFGGSFNIASQLGVAGVIELVGGLAILLGFFTRLAALGGALLMLAAYFTVHIGSGFNPLVNGGELALVYFAAFLVLMSHGNKYWSLEQKLLKKEVF
jgi:putative oxidoreductase